VNLERVYRKAPELAEVPIDRHQQTGVA